MNEEQHEQTLLYYLEQLSGLVKKFNKAADELGNGLEDIISSSVNLPEIIGKKERLILDTTINWCRSVKSVSTGISDISAALSNKIYKEDKKIE